ncbi:MAG TPA: hypothetical protein VM369_10260 [Candidatus Binatia bacterium]|nr:hypothetical protein [Candidatus Binatia bacterium]
MSRVAFTALAAALALPALGAEPGSGFNPKISLILDSQYAARSVPDSVPAGIGGFLPGGESEFGPRSFSLGETELVLESNVDDQWHGWTTIALAPEGGVGIEEAYVNTLALPAGLALKLGRFKSEIGYQNHVHAHAWEFVDAPLVYRAFFGGQYQDDGVQARWVAPLDLLVELGAEATRGDAFPGGGAAGNGVGAWTAFLHAGGDVGEGGSWRAGLSHLQARARERTTGEVPDDTLFTGTSRVSGADFVWKWAPGGDHAATNLVVHAEAFLRHEAGTLLNDPSGAANASAYDGDQQGAYVQGIWQFMPRWRVGLRYDRLHADNRVAAPVPGTALATLADDGDDPQRGSVMADFSNSEFSRIRVQYSRDASRPGGVRDDQYFVQFVYSLGSHPAHQF